MFIPPQLRKNWPPTFADVEAYNKGTTMYKNFKFDDTAVSNMLTCCAHYLIITPFALQYNAAHEAEKRAKEGKQDGNNVENGTPPPGSRADPNPTALTGTTSGQDASPVQKEPEAPEDRGTEMAIPKDGSGEVAQVEGGDDPVSKASAEAKQAVQELYQVCKMCP